MNDTGFVRRHAYRNATWRDLLSAIESASGQSLKTFGERYVLQPGVPRVRTKLELQGNRIQSLTLNQSAENVGAGTVWPMRLQIRLGYSNGEDVVIPATLDRGELAVAKAAGLPAPDYAWANDGDFGYGPSAADNDA